MIVYVYDHEEKRVKYWVCMNNGRPVIGAKCNAARFEKRIIESALRQIKTLYLADTVGALDEDVRSKAKDHLPATDTAKQRERELSV